MKRQIEKLTYKLNEAPTKTDLDIIRARMDELEKMLSRLQKLVSDHDKKLKSKIGGGGGQVDTSGMESLGEELERLKHEVNSQNVENQLKFSDMTSLVNTKADKSEIKELYE